MREQEASPAPPCVDLGRPRARLIPAHKGKASSFRFLRAKLLMEQLLCDLPSPASRCSPPGLQIIFPQHLQEKFVQSALSYIMCNGEGEYVCQNSQCRCQCGEEFPQCNCPVTDIQIVEHTLASMAKSWADAYKDLEDSGREPRGTVARRPTCLGSDGHQDGQGEPAQRPPSPPAFHSGGSRAIRVAVKGEALNKSPPSGIMNNIIKFVVL